MRLGNSNITESDKSCLTWFWTALIIAVIANFLLFLSRLWRMPFDQLVQFIYDDGFYYLILAKNFYHLKIWTFDGGLTITSGFHPLFAYCLVVIYALFKTNPLTYIHAALCFSVAITVASFIPLYFVKLDKKWALLAACAFISSTLNFSYNTISLVEWPLVIFIASFYLAYIYNADWSKSYWSHCFVLAGLGCIGSLARIDFGALPFALACVGLVMLAISRQHRYCIPLFSGLLGAVIGVILVMLHDYYFTGILLQSSAVMKLMWTGMGGPNPYPFYAQLITLFLGNFYQENVINYQCYLWPYLLPIAFFFVSLAFVYVAIILLVSRKTSTNTVNDIPVDYSSHNATLVIGASLLTLVFYGIFYSFNTGALQPWYTENCIIPIIILMAGLLALCQSRCWIYFVNIVVAAMVLSHIVTLSSLKIVPWHSQQALFKAGIYLKEHAFPGNVGSWNAGIISYVAEKPVINLDGLVNNDMYPYISADRVECYILKKNINIIIDSAAMFYPYYKIRGGYTHNLDKHLKVIYSVNDGPHVKVNVYAVDRKGLARHNVC